MLDFFFGEDSVMSGTLKAPVAISWSNPFGFFPLAHAKFQKHHILGSFSILLFVRVTLMTCSQKLQFPKKIGEKTTFKKNLFTCQASTNKWVQSNKNIINTVYHHIVNFSCKIYYFKKLQKGASEAL